MSFDERSYCKLTTLAVDSFGRLGEEGYKFIDELATHAAGGMHGFERSIQGTTSSSNLDGYTGGHVAKSLTIQAVAPRTTRRRKKPKIDLTRTDTDDLGTKCR